MATNSSRNGLAKILLVDDEPENLRALERTLRNDFQTIASASPEEALEQLKIEGPNIAVVVSDQRMPSMMGTEFLARVSELYPLATRMILTGYTDTREMLDAINRAEIYRYITKPWNNEELILAVRQGVERHKLRCENQQLITELTRLNQSLEKLVDDRTAELKAANERLNELAMTDPLTKIHNRRSFMAKFGDEIERAKRYKHRLTVAMIDVDHFKKFNDMEGHLCGDEALRKIAQLLTSRLRKTDVLGRYGGEEFILLMPETRLEVGTEICERLRVGVEKEDFQGNSKVAYLTVSIGVSGMPEHGTNANDLIKNADHALYQAKQFGRNRVVTER